MKNNTVLILTDCKDALINTYEEYLEFEYGDTDFNFNANLSDEEYRKVRIIVSRVYTELNLNVPQEFTDSRSIKEFIYAIRVNPDYRNYNGQQIVGEIASMFNSVLDHLEEQSLEVQIIKIECDIPNELTYEHILEDLKQCDKRIDDEDYSGAITRARTLIEGVFKEIIFNITGEEVGGNENLPNLLKKVQICLNLNPSDEKLAKPLKEVISGLVSMVNGLNMIRNKVGDAHSNNSNLSLHHALLVVNATKTLVAFLFHTYEYQREKGKIVASL
ncbi:abortive infection family protein [Bacillus albus]|uniref:abortive infection family protein n=1 Tax=Bacillus albus TaxID=2026189 RepID=UPI00234AB366|nr:abortive infection family protein [Bacillus albus]MDC6156552.1 abortive infection family protein [Bacillus albus]MDD8006029.1 abortive infection family protein [Bacillus albus]